MKFPSHKNFFTDSVKKIFEDLVGVSLKIRLEISQIFSWKSCLTSFRSFSLNFYINSSWHYSETRQRILSEISLDIFKYLSRNSCRQLFGDSSESFTFLFLKFFSKQSFKCSSRDFFRNLSKNFIEKMHGILHAFV